MPLLDWIKNTYENVRPNAQWDIIKYVLWLLGSAIMATGIFSALFVYFSSVSLNWIIIISLFLLSFTLIFIAFVAGRIAKDDVALEISAPDKSPSSETTNATNKGWNTNTQTRLRNSLKKLANEHTTLELQLANIKHLPLERI